jgi:hypothetical protein
MLGKGMAKLGKRLMADPTESAVTSARRGERTANEKGGNTIIKETGGNWLTGGVGSVERALQPLKRGEFVDVPQLQDPATAAVNKWVDSNLTNYVKKQMATPDDPVRKLAEEGVIHIPTNEVGVNRYRAGKVREVQGQPQLGKSDAAKAWEDSTDTLIYPAPAGEYTKPLTAQEIQQGKKSIVDEYPWLEKVAPETLINAAGFGIGKDLGFDHILDVLRADVAAGRIRPEQLNKVSMEQAVRRTYEYDQEMARKMAETQIKVTEGMPVKKEYPEGYKWIQLAPPKELPSGYSTLLDDVTGSYKVVDETGKEAFPRQPNSLGQINVPFFKTPDEAIADALKRDSRLADALKYEGDTMGHCVGGYCDDVRDGKSNIFSLRDAKGEPHVTIETSPSEITPFDMPKEIYDEYRRHAAIGTPAHGGRPGATEWLQHFYPDVAKQIIPPDRIVQIKGKGNAKPKEDYLPFVQDFVRGDNWSQVGDFKNTGLEWHATGPKGIFGQEEVKALEQAGYKVPKYLTNAEKDDLMRKWYELDSGNDYDTGLPKATPKPDAPPAEGMANGGGVLKYTTLRNRNTTQSQPNRFAVGGILKHTTLRGMKDGGKSEMKPTPRKKGYGVASDVLKGVHEFASKPFGYENPPVELLSELLGIPAASRVLDKLSYGEPITNAGKANVPLIPDDTFDAATAGLGGLGAASKLAKPLAKGAKYLPKNLPVGMSIKPVGDDIFSKAERDANLSNFLANSKTPERMYHGTRKDIDAFKQSPSGIFFSPNPMVANKFAANNMLDIGTSTVPTEGANVMPVYVRTEKPFDVSKKSDVSKVTSLLEDKRDISRFKKGASESDWKTLEAYSDFIEQAGFDGYFVKEFGENNLSVFKPNQIKSAIGNRGTYDINEADINKARGGSILKHTTLRNRRANQRVR